MNRVVALVTVWGLLGTGGVVWATDEGGASTPLSPEQLTERFGHPQQFVELARRFSRQFPAKKSGGGEAEIWGYLNAYADQLAQTPLAANVLARRIVSATGGLLQSTLLPARDSDGQQIRFLQPAKESLDHHTGAEADEYLLEGALSLRRLRGLKKPDGTRFVAGIALQVETHSPATYAGANSGAPASHRWTELRLRPDAIGTSALLQTQDLIFPTAADPRNTRLKLERVDVVVTPLTPAHFLVYEGTQTAAKGLQIVRQLISTQHPDVAELTPWQTHVLRTFRRQQGTRTFELAAQFTKELWRTNRQLKARRAALPLRGSQISDRQADAEVGALLTPALNRALHTHWGGRDKGAAKYLYHPPRFLRPPQGKGRVATHHRTPIRGQMRPAKPVTVAHP